MVAVAQRVLDQVRERAPQLRRRRRGGAAGRPRSTSRTRSGCSGVLDRGADDLLERAPVLARLGGTRLQAREVEQLVDEPRQAPALVRDRVGQLDAGPSGSSDGEPSASPAATIAVSGERRSCETDRSTAVLISSLRRSALVSTTSAVSRSRSSAAHSSASRAEPHARARRPRPRWARAACQARRAGSPRARSSPSTRSSTTAAESIRSASAMHLAAGAESRARLRRAEQQASQLRRQVGLAAPLLRLLGALAGQLGERRGDHGRDEEDDQRDPVLGVGDREPAGRRDVEEVERRAPPRRPSQAEAQAPERGDEQHGEQVERRRARRLGAISLSGYSSSVVRPARRRRRSRQRGGASGHLHVSLDGGKA